MNSNLKKTVIFILMINMILILTGCTPTRYDEKEETRVVEEGKVLLDRYLDSLSEINITDRKYGMMVASESGYIYSGYYLSHVVRCDFKADDKWYELYVNLEDGNYYTNYQMFDIKEQLKRQLKPYCEKYGYYGDFDISFDTYLMLDFFITSHDVPVKGKEKTDVLVPMTNVLPAQYCGENEDEMADMYFNDLPLCEFDISYVIEDDNIMDSRILIDYLKNSGNYIGHKNKGETGDALYYRITGHSLITDEIEQPYSYTSVICVNDTIKNPSIELRQINMHKENNMEILYARKEADVDVHELDDIEYTEYEFPFVINEDSFIYEKTFSDYVPRLRFIIEPSFKEVTRIIGDEKETMNMTINEDNRWVPVLNNGSNFVPLWYGVEETQIIEFK